MVGWLLLRHFCVMKTTFFVLFSFFLRAKCLIEYFDLNVSRITLFSLSQRTELRANVLPYCTNHALLRFILKFLTSKFSPSPSGNRKSGPSPAIFHFKEWIFGYFFMYLFMKQCIYLYWQIYIRCYYLFYCIGRWNMKKNRFLKIVFKINLIKIFSFFQTSPFLFAEKMYSWVLLCF